MAWTTPRTWVGGELVDQTIMNSAIRDNENILKTSISNDGSTWSGSGLVAGSNLIATAAQCYLELRDGGVTSYFIQAGVNAMVPNDTLYVRGEYFGYFANRQFHDVTSAFW